MNILNNISRRLTFQPGYIILVSLLCVVTSVNAADDTYKFIVFGDFNGGDCSRNERVQKSINAMAKEKGIAFYVSTGDLIDGYVNNNATMCFASDPVKKIPDIKPCGPGINNGNVAEMVAPLKSRKPVQGLKSSFYPVIGNHDDNWGSSWYPDPCGDGICDFLAPQTPDTFINHDHGDMCSKDQGSSSHSRDFYYSFTYKNSYFIILRINNDDWTMFSACNNHPGFKNCADYCTAPELKGNSERADNCWGGVEQYDWLVDELKKAQKYDNIFVFTHAVALGSGDGHLPFAGAGKLRQLLEKYNVDIFINGHNHFYQRTKKVMGGDDRGNGGRVDEHGVIYLTVGSAGAEFDAANPHVWFNAKTAYDWTKYGQPDWKDKMTTYTIISVNGKKVKGNTKSIAIKGSVDKFKIK